MNWLNFQLLVWSVPCSYGSKDSPKLPNCTVTMPSLTIYSPRSARMAQLQRLESRVTEPLVVSLPRAWSSGTTTTTLMQVQLLFWAYSSTMVRVQQEDLAEKTWWTSNSQRQALPAAKQERARLSSWLNMQQPSRLMRLDALWAKYPLKLKLEKWIHLWSGGWMRS